MKKVLIIIFILTMLVPVYSQVQELDGNNWVRFDSSAKTGFVVGFLTGSYAHFLWLMKEGSDIPENKLIEMFSSSKSVGTIIQIMDYHYSFPENRKNLLYEVYFMALDKSFN